MAHLLVDAKTLKGNNNQKRQLDDYIESIISQLNKDIKIARADGSHHIIAELPMIFNISNMAIKDSQRIVWSNIISILKNKNFEVFIKHTSDRCFLKISWISAAEEEIVNHQLLIIKNHMQDF